MNIKMKPRHTVGIALAILLATVFTFITQVKWRRALE